MASFSDRVDHYHDGIFSIRFRQLYYKVNANGIPRCVRNWERVQLSGWQLTNRLSLETHIAGGDIFAYVPRHLWPPIIP